MTNTIMDTSNLAEMESNGDEPNDPQSDFAATHAAENVGIEFHVSMRSYTKRDMEDLIVEAAASQIIGRFGNERVAKLIEAKCIELLNEKAMKALAAVTTEIIDQPITPSFGDKTPVTMREFIGLTGRDYMMQKVDCVGKPATSGYGSSNSMSRIEYLASNLMQQQFAQELQKATNAMISQIQGAVKKSHESILAAENARLREALAKAVA